jgi:hypothetical protein
MSESLDPREIARIKKLARSARIRRIRRRTAVAAATLAALFSGAILARGQLDQSTLPGDTTTALVSRAGADGEDESQGEDVGVVETVLQSAVQAIGGDTTGQGQSPPPASAAQPLTTSQS